MPLNRARQPRTQSHRESNGLSTTNHPTFHNRHTPSTSPAPPPTPGTRPPAHPAPPAARPRLPPWRRAPTSPHSPQYASRRKLTPPLCIPCRSRRASHAAPLRRPTARTPPVRPPSLHGASAPPPAPISLILKCPKSIPLTIRHYPKNIPPKPVVSHISLPSPSSLDCFAFAPSLALPHPFRRHSHYLAPPAGFAACAPIAPIASTNASTRCIVRTSTPYRLLTPYLTFACAPLALSSSAPSFLHAPSLPLPSHPPYSSPLLSRPPTPSLFPPSLLSTLLLHCVFASPVCPLPHPPPLPLFLLLFPIPLLLPSPPPYSPSQLPLSVPHLPSPTPSSPPLLSPSPTSPRLGALLLPSGLRGRFCVRMFHVKQWGSVFRKRTDVSRETLHFTRVLHPNGATRPRAHTETPPSSRVLAFSFVVLVLVLSDFEVPK